VTRVAEGRKIFFKFSNERSAGEGCALDDLPNSAVYLFEHRRVMGLKV